jgi:hypothetical protein
VAERVGFEPTATPIEISKFMKTLQLCVPSGPLLSPLLAVDLAVEGRYRRFSVRFLDALYLRRYSVPFEVRH